MKTKVRKAVNRVLKLANEVSASTNKMGKNQYLVVKSLRPQKLLMFKAFSKKEAIAKAETQAHGFTGIYLLVELNSKS